MDIALGRAARADEEGEEGLEQIMQRAQREEHDEGIVEQVGTPPREHDPGAEGLHQCIGGLVEEAAQQAFARQAQDGDVDDGGADDEGNEEERRRRGLVVARKADDGEGERQEKVRKMVTPTSRGSDWPGSTNSSPTVATPMA